MTEARNAGRKVDFTAYAHPVLAVPCPDCKAAAGVWCKRPSGWKASDFLKDRKTLADNIWEAQGDPPIIRTETGFAYGERPAPSSERQRGAGKGRRRPGERKDGFERA